MGIWNLDTPAGEYQNKEATELYDHTDGMHEFFPKIGDGLTSKHGSPETETSDAHVYISKDVGDVCKAGTMR